MIAANEEKAIEQLGNLDDVAVALSNAARELPILNAGLRAHEAIVDQVFEVASDALHDADEPMVGRIILGFLAADLVAGAEAQLNGEDS